MQAKWNSVTSSQGALSFVTLTNILRMIIPKCMEPGQHSLFSGWATGLTIQVSITGKGKRFFTFPKPPRQVWDPPNLLFGGYSNEQSYICSSPVLVCLHDMDSGNFRTKYMVLVVDVARMEEMAWNTIGIIVNTVIASSSSSYWLQKL
jgi:hypothetical protein